jgi:hypothetical protein
VNHTRFVVTAWSRCQTTLLELDRVYESYLKDAINWNGASSSVGFDSSNAVIIQELGAFHCTGGCEGALMLQIRSHPSTEAAKIHSVRNKDSQEIVPRGRWMSIIDLGRGFSLAQLASKK